ncbi:hypothetical protein A3D77_02690 [Candidatus Gottesmanbacteria bacterium RIFCSPHIGHO2_02_FULL_39_11]|uniref:DNA topoisomerase (ATP-hydrolyzing) n=1 Tax=Candidatus Gottesmanbacteria bacterium RIFCSPHIGHO2_02_FULL_39_11 TaxID=1798382 RepID=A0A1F5ZSY0_9BACT|nr:MAG: hypothetical protein A3D77_02690 [Candidatus Gottesmanbacteria bacterium RIFCSPHIGHO2_02_FULL_39_11]
MTKQTYSGEQIVVLEGLEPVRKRPAMYIGSTSLTGVHHCVTEIIDNSVDEALAGFSQNIWIILHKDNSVTVADDGRGIPVDIVPKYKTSALEIVMTKLHAGGKFSGDAYKVSGGLHGVGASVVNALSKWMEVIVTRDGKSFSQKYERGAVMSPVAPYKKNLLDLTKNLPSHFKYTSKNGTISNFLLDEEIFKEGIAATYDTIKRQIKERAYLVSKLFFHLFDERSNEEDHYYFEGGITSLVASVNRTRSPLHPPIFIQKQEGDVQLQAALQYNDGFSESVESFVNVINTIEGGSHLTGFRMALTRAINDYGKKIGAIKEGDDAIIGEDTREGLTAVVFIKMPATNLQFEGQTKTKLGNAEIQPFVQTTVNEALDVFFEEHPSDARRILEKVFLAAKARLAAKAAKDAIIRKGALEGSSLPGKLADCQSRDPKQSELYIVEGDSAGGCFSGDTKVALTDGRNLSFKELIAEDKAGKRNYCYSINSCGLISIALIKNPRITKKNTQIIKVILDNDEEIICTPDHLFMLRDGSYKQASNLTPDDSLMPLRKQLSRIGRRITIKDYEMVFDPGQHRWIFTHMIADKYNLDSGNYTLNKGAYRHHIDFNKHNNNPDNLTRLTKEEHLNLHKSHIEKTLHRPDSKIKAAQAHQTDRYKEKIKLIMSSPIIRQQLRQNARKQWQNQEYKKYMLQKFLEFYNTNSEYRKKNNQLLNYNQKRYWSSQHNRLAQSKRVSQFFHDHPEIKISLRNQANQLWENYELRKWRQQKTKEQWTPEFRSKRYATYNKTYLNKALNTLHQIYINSHKINKDQYNLIRKTTNDKNLLKYDTICHRFFNDSEQNFHTAITYYNHRVKAVILLQQKIDVYDIEVPETHNFALSSGIFVHNSAKQGRDRKFQAILPLRGKILNTERARLDRVLEFAEIKDLVIALGMGIAESLNPEKLRYHRIIIMTDADVDGEHIRTLLLTFFFRHLPYVVQNSHLYVAQPPLYKIQIGKESHYVYSEEEKDALLAKAKGGKFIPGLQRYKGLGEMNPEQLWDTTMNPANRILKQINVAEAVEADEVFSMLMGDEVLPRKRFIQTHAKSANLDV